MLWNNYMFAGLMKEYDDENLLKIFITVILIYSRHH